jgi:hypothetical protein
VVDARPPEALAAGPAEPVLLRDDSFPAGCSPDAQTVPQEHCAPVAPPGDWSADVRARTGWAAEDDYFAVAPPDGFVPPVAAVGSSVRLAVDSLPPEPLDADSALAGLVQADSPQADSPDDFRLGCPCPVVPDAEHSVEHQDGPWSPSPVFPLARP